MMLYQGINYLRNPVKFGWQQAAFPADAPRESGSARVIRIVRGVFLACAKRLAGPKGPLIRMGRFLGALRGRARRAPEKLLVAAIAWFI